MQFSQYRTGCTVRARGARWRVVDLRAFDACRIVTLSGIAPPFLGSERRFIEPFDTIASVDGAGAALVVGPTRWRTACRTLLADHAPPGGLRHARFARIDLLPHQLEPVLAVLAGRGTRLLLAGG